MVEVAFTDRFGGLSTGPYAELSLSAHSTDEEAVVGRNRELVARALGGADVRGLVVMRQVHGAEVFEVAPDAAGALTSAAEDRSPTRW